MSDKSTTSPDEPTTIDEPTTMDDIVTVMNDSHADMTNQYYVLIDIIYDLLNQMPQVQLTQEQFDHLIQGIQKQIKLNNDMIRYIMSKVVIKQYTTDGVVKK